jgi:nicotinamidase/pyrazinamidase
MIWPAHCVVGTSGAEFHADLTVLDSDIIVSKGVLERVDSYSGFGSSLEVTELHKILSENGIKRVFCVGLAYDYCVGSTAIDAAIRGYETFLIRDATRSVAPESELEMTDKLIKAGVNIVNSEHLKELTPS